MSLFFALYVLGVPLNKQQTAISLSLDFLVLNSSNPLFSLMIYLTPWFLAQHVACSKAYHSQSLPIPPCTDLSPFITPVAG